MSEIHPWKLTCPLKINGWKMYSLLKWPLFGGHVSVQGNIWKKNIGTSIVAAMLKAPAAGETTGSFLTFQFQRNDWVFPETCFAKTSWNPKQPFKDKWLFFFNLVVSIWLFQLKWWTKSLFRKWLFPHFHPIWTVCIGSQVLKITQPLGGSIKISCPFVGLKIPLDNFYHGSLTKLQW